MSTKPKTEQTKPEPPKAPAAPAAPAGEDLAIELDLLREENAELKAELDDAKKENAELKAELEEQAAASGLAAYRGQAIEPGAFLVQRKIRYVPRGGAEVVIAEPGDVVRNLKDKDAERFHAAGVTVPHVKIGG